MYSLINNAKKASPAPVGSISSAGFSSFIVILKSLQIKSEPFCPLVMMIKFGISILKISFELFK